MHSLKVAIGGTQRGENEASRRTGKKSGNGGQHGHAFPQGRNRGTQRGKNGASRRIKKKSGNRAHSNPQNSTRGVGGRTLGQRWAGGGKMKRTPNEERPRGTQSFL